MRNRRHPGALLWLAPLLLSACGDSSRTRGIDPTGPTSADTIVVESAKLETVGRREPLRQRWPECHVRGELRNDGPRPLRVTLSFTAFDRRDEVMARATARVDVGETGGRAQYRAVLLHFDDCDPVHRFEITGIETEAL
jgi:hypothetical protein